MIRLTCVQQDLVKKHIPVSRSIAREFPVLGIEEAESEACVALCEAVGSHDPGKAPLKAWIIRVVRNHLNRKVDQHRARLEQEQSFPVDDEGRPIDPRDNLAEQSRAGSEDKEWISNHLDNLRPLDRLLIEEVFLKGRSGTEVAASLGVSKSSLQRRIQTVLSRLRADIEAEDRGQHYDADHSRVREGGDSGSRPGHQLAGCFSGSGETPDRKAG